MARRPFGLVDFVLLALVLALAAGVRVWYIVAVADGGLTSGPLVVQDSSPVLSLPSETEMRGRAQPTELDALVHNLKQHSWYGSLAPLAAAEERTAHVSPGYPWLLSLLARWLPAEDVDPAARWLQCGAGVLTAGLYFLFGRRAFDSRLVGALAGLLTALHPFWIINTAAINDGTAATFLLALVLFLGTVAGQSGGAFASLLYGLSLAGLALLRAALLPFAFVALLWLLWRSRKVERGWLCALLAFLGFANGLAPWGIRNFQAFGEPVPIVTSTWLHLWEGNNPQATGGPLSERQLVEALASSRHMSAAVVQADLGGLPQSSRYRRLSRDVLAEIEKNPARTVYRRMSAACYFFGSESLARKGKIVRIQTQPDEETPHWIEESAAPLLLASLVLMIGFALVAWRWTYPWRVRAIPSSLALICIPLPYILGHAESLHGPRLPLDGVLLTYAAFVLACPWPATAKALLDGPQDREEASRKHP